jgi:hypothetical protein
LLTFSPFVCGAEILVAGKRARFNRIGLVSFVEFVVCFDGINKRGAEQGNEISITEFAKIKQIIVFGEILFLNNLLFFVPFSCSIKSSKSISLSVSFDDTTTRVVVPCTTVRVGTFGDSAMTKFRFTTVRDGVSGESRTGLLGFSGCTGTGIGAGGAGGGGGIVSVLIVGDGSGVDPFGILGGLGTGEDLIASLLTRFVVEARMNGISFFLIKEEFFTSKS